MKKILLALFLICGMAFGQLVNETQDGLNHKTFNVYTKASYTSSTANETTGFYGTYNSNRIALFTTVTDTIKGVLHFQFKNSFTGYTTDWRTVADSISLIGSSSYLAPLRVHAFVPSDTSTTGYDQIRFFVDYVTYLGTAYTGGTLRIYMDIYKP